MTGNRDDRTLTRIMRLLLVLSVDDRISVEELVVDRMPEYFPTDPDDTAWIRRKAWRTGVSDVERERVRKLVDDDLKRLQLMGFGASRETVGERGEELDEEFVVLRQRPFVPVSLDPSDVPTVVSLVAASLGAGVSADPPVRALVFAQAAADGVLVDMTRLGRSPIRIVPLRVVLQESGRWYGLGAAADTRKPLSFRLAPDSESGERWSPEVTAEAAPSWAAGLELDAERLLHPLTWGEALVPVTVAVAAPAVDRVRGLVGPALVAEVPDAVGVRMSLEVTEVDELVRRLAPYAWAVEVLDPEPVRLALREHLAAMTEPAAWIPDGIRPLDAALAPGRAIPVPATTEEDPDVDGAPIPPARLRKTVVNRMGALLLVLRALRDVPEIGIDQLVELVGFDAAAVDTLLTLYVAAESSVANELPDRSANVRPLRLDRDDRGQLVRVRHDDTVSARDDSIASLGRVEVTQGQLLTALAAALDLLEDAPERTSAGSLRRFVESAADALGVDPADVDGDVVEAAVVPPAPSLLARAAHDGAFVAFTYVDPWTLQSSSCRVQPMALRQLGQQALLDGIDLDAPAEPVTARVRTFALAGMGEVKVLRGLEADRVAESGVDPDLLEALVGEAQRRLTVTLAVLPISEAAEILRWRWRARTMTRDDGVVVAEVDLVEPTTARLGHLLLECGADARVVFPEDLRDLGAQRARAALGAP